MKIFAYNPDLTDTEVTYLSNSTVVGQTAFTVKNIAGFSNGQKVLLGSMDRERSEIRTVQSSPTGTTVTLDAALFPHDADDPAYALKYDQVRIYRSTTGQAGVYSLLDTIDIDVDNPSGKTWYDDDNSLDTYWYTVSYYDSANDEETEQSAAVQSTGYAKNQIGAVIQEVARKVKDPDFLNMEQETYLDCANDISTDLQTQAKRPYRFLKRAQLLDIAADSDTVDLPDTLWNINYLEVNETTNSSNRVFRPKIVSATQARYQNAEFPNSGDYVKEVAYDDEENQIIVCPPARTERIGAFNLHFYKKFDDFTSFSDVIEGPTRLAYKLGLLRDYYMQLNDKNYKYASTAQSWDSKYSAEVMKLQRTKNIEAGSPFSLAPDKKRYPQFGGRRYRQ